MVREGVRPSGDEARSLPAPQQHCDPVVEESNGDLMGDGVNIAARLEGIADPGGICLSEDAYRQVRDRLKEQFVDLGEKELKNIARPVRVYSIKIDLAGPLPPPQPSAPEKSAPPRLSIVVLPFANLASWTACARPGCRRDEHSAISHLGGVSVWLCQDDERSQAINSSSNALPGF